jgi:SAM-dependent methyltransferase
MGRLGDDGDAQMAQVILDHTAKTKSPAPEPDSFPSRVFYFPPSPRFAPPPMPALALPPSPPEIELSTVSFFGRSLEEYTQFFSLDLAALRGRAVLDVAAGPASFTAEACRRGVDAVAVDPLYGCTSHALATHVQLDYAKMIAQMRAKPGLFRLRSFGSLAAAETDRRAAAQRFLNDYDAHFVHGRYLGASLPRLPFLNEAFDLVLCAHLLFIYARRFDFAWHLAACCELARVSAGEVRIHPVCGADGRPYPELARLRRELLAQGVTSEVVKIDYEFFVGSGSMLVLNREVA